MMNEKAVNDKQSLKRRRIKIYFLEAAKEIITSEGVENVSVRKIADIAGYSYATIYNYFEDLNELLWEVKKAMINDLVRILQKKMYNVSLDIDGIKKIFRTYTAYYFENPYIFKFFYFHKLIQPNKKPNNTEIEPNFDAMMKETFMNFVLEGKLNMADIEVVGKTCIYAVHGMLTLHLSGNGELTQESIYKDIDKMVEYLL